MIQNNLVSLDESLTYGDILGAVQRHFDDEVAILFNKTRMVGKDLRIRSLSDFLQSIKHVNKIQLLGNNIKKNESYSLFIFDFTNTKDEQLIWNEVIRRKWKNGKVVEEEYYLHPTKKQLEKCKSKSGILAFEEEQPQPKKVVAKTPPKPKVAAEPKLVPTKRAYSRRTTKPAGSELLKINGIGPKICAALNAKGINSFNDLVQLNKTELSEILGTVGARYKNFDPSSWITQAKKLSK